MNKVWILGLLLHVIVAFTFATDPQPGVVRKKMVARLKRPEPKGGEIRKVLKAVPKGAGASEGSSQLNRDGRFFSLFTVVRFANDLCLTTSGNNGTCYTANECRYRGGLSEGSCASGFGVCCFFQFECGRVTSENGTYFRNPTTDVRICNLQVDRLGDHICQVRIEMDQFELNGPDERGVCSSDFFVVTGGSAVPLICGSNTGQHLVYSVTPNSGPTQLSVVVDNTVAASTPRAWKMRIYQLECSNPLLAPSGCLQYFTGASGIIQSFNYKTTVTANRPNMLANMNYAICIRNENGFCGIRYSQPPNDPFSFTLSTDASTITSTSTFPLNPTGVLYGDTNCKNDYIIIPNGSQSGMDIQGVSLSRDRYCGIALGYCGIQGTASTTCVVTSGAVTTLFKPFLVGVVTDADEGPITSPTDKQNRGFYLLYSQQPCVQG